MKAYLLDEDQLAKLRALSEQLHNGTGRERDYGHRLWLVLGEIEKQPFEEEARGGIDKPFPFWHNAHRRTPIRSRAFQPI